MSFILETNYLTDSKSNIEAIRNAAHSIHRLLEIFDLFDEHVNDLDILDSSNAIKDTFDIILLLSNGIFSESELRERYTLTAYNCLAIFESFSTDEDYVSKVMSMYSSCNRQIKSKNELHTKLGNRCPENSKFNELYELVLSEYSSDSNSVSSQGLQLFLKIREEWSKRFELLLKLLFFISTKSFNLIGSNTSDNIDCSQDFVEINFGIDQNIVSKRISYSDLIHSFTRLNLVKHYLRLFEGYVTSCIKKLGPKDAPSGSTQVINDKLNIIMHLKSTTSYKNNPSLCNHLLNSITAHINLVKSVKIYIATASKFFNDSSGTVVEIDSKYLEELINSLLEDVFCDLMGNFPKEIAFLDGIKVIDSFIELLNKHSLNYHDNIHWYKEYTIKIMNKFEESLLDYIRQLTINQYDSTTLMNPNTVNVYSDNEYILRPVDPKSVGEMITSILSETFEKGVSEQFMRRINWLNGFGSLFVSNSMYLISIVLFRLSLMPNVILNQLHMCDRIHPEIIKLYVEKNSNIIQNTILLFVLLSLNTFKDFVYMIPKFLRENNDSKILLSNFLVFLSNSSFFSNILPLVPYLVQDSLGLSFTIIPELQRFKDLSHIVKELYKISALRLSLFKVKDYLVTQLVAFNQQCIQKILLNDIKLINNSFECHGNDLIDWLVTFKINSHKHLPTSLYKKVFQLSMDLCYSSIINLFLDFFEKHNYKLPETNILRTRIYLDSVLYSLQEHILPDCNELNMEFVMEEKFLQVVKLFRYDYSIISSKEFEQVDLNRLTKLSKLIKSFDTS
ncbi:conserved hypothetical protein [Theileria equi strain WA]|uniref:Uncharacterized protein n=1 Tax=Theileria equi strain WA TaxID=1537102 RepID=L1LCI6_THEEQ|nr:conserved hypothetical protein [Theileria equi strain WA]EKX73152.1 conserved hypothetical protein [Theileria equi strain WA]|eukprot:XP_004832604.1 conserved hypothetical protein [Theileria equi strain WA]